MDRKNSQAITRVTAFIALCATAGAIACSSDSIALPRTEAQAATTTTAGGTDTTGTPSTSNEPVASVTVSPHVLSVAVGFRLDVVATPRDAKGVTVAGKHATWTTSNSAVIAVTDTGTLYAKALGTAKVYGTIDGHVDSATVTVTATPVDTSGNHSPPPTPVSSFNLTVSVAGSVAGADSSVHDPVAGASVAVMRVMSVRGDTLNPSVLAGTIVTDAKGVGTLPNLPGGYYTFLATPPAGSVYAKSSFGLGAPTSSDVNVNIVLRKAP